MAVLEAGQRAANRNMGGSNLRSDRPGSALGFNTGSAPQLLIAIPQRSTGQGLDADQYYSELLLIYVRRSRAV